MASEQPEPKAFEAELAREVDSARLFAGVAPEPVAQDLVDSVRDSTHKLIAAETGWRAELRAMPTGRRVVLLVMVGAIAAVLCAGLAPRLDWDRYPPARMIATLLAFGALGAVAIWGALRPLYRPAAPRYAAVLLLALSIAAPLALSLVQHDQRGFDPGQGALFAARCSACLATGGALALPLLVLALVARRAEVCGVAAAALAGAAAGLFGNAALQVHCAVVDRAHLLIGHVLLLPLFIAAVGAWQAARDRRRDGGDRRA